MRIVALVLLCGCSAAALSGGKSATGGKAAPVMGAAPGSAHISAGSGHGGGVLAVGVGIASMTTYPDGRRPPPPMDPERKVEEVDCTKPVDFTSGNLKCK